MLPCCPGSNRTTQILVIWISKSTDYFTSVLKYNYEVEVFHVDWFISLEYNIDTEAEKEIYGHRLSSACSF